MPGSVEREPVRRPPAFPHLRDTKVVDGRTLREHVVGVDLGRDEKTGLRNIVHAREFHYVREEPRVPRDRLTRTRGKHRRNL